VRAARSVIAANFDSAARLVRATTFVLNLRGGQTGKPEQEKRVAKKSAPMARGRQKMSEFAPEL